MHIHLQLALVVVAIGIVRVNDERHRSLRFFVRSRRHIADLLQRLFRAEITETLEDLAIFLVGFRVLDFVGTSLGCSASFSQAGDHLNTSFSDAARVVDDSMRQSRFLFLRPLSSDALLRLLLGDGISLHKPLQANTALGENRPNFVVVVLLTRFEEERHFQSDDVAFERLDPLFADQTNGRMHQGIQFFTRLRVVEDDCSEPLAVNGSIWCVHQIIAESVKNGAIDGVR